MAGTLDANTIRLALKHVGDHLGDGPPIEILIVGGAAALLTGELGGSITTGDVDLMQCRPPDDEEVLRAAGKAGRELSLPPSWLNRDAGLFRHSLPDDWETRRVDVGTFGRLRVFAIGRMDLIAMKFMAHRPADRQHLDVLKVTPEELEFVARYLDTMAVGGREDAGKIDMARFHLKHYRARLEGHGGGDKHRS